MMIRVMVAEVSGTRQTLWCTGRVARKNLCYS